MSIRLCVYLYQPVYDFVFRSSESGEVAWSRRCLTHYAVGVHHFDPHPSPVSVNSPSPWTVAQHADASEDDEAATDSSANNVVMVTGRSHTIPERSCRFCGIEHQREELDYADYDGTNDSECGEYYRVVQKGQRIFDLSAQLWALIVMERSWSLDVKGWTVSRIDLDQVRSALLKRLRWSWLLVTAIHAQRSNVQTHHQRAIGRVDETHSSCKEDGKDQNEPDACALCALNAANTEKRDLTAGIETQPEENTKRVHLPRPIDQFEHPLQNTEEEASTFDLPCLLGCFLGLKSDNFLHLHDKPVQDVRIHDSQQEEEGGGHRGANYSADIAEAVEAFGYTSCGGRHNNRCDDDNSAMT